MSSEREEREGERESDDCSQGRTSAGKEGLAKAPAWGWGGWRGMGGTRNGIR